jgi:hypothetical protein
MCFIHVFFLRLFGRRFRLLWLVLARRRFGPFLGGLLFLDGRFLLAVVDMYNHSDPLGDNIIAFLLELSRK